MTGQTYQRWYIATTNKEEALKALEKAKALEAEREELVRQGKLIKIVTEYPDEHRTSTKYVKP